MTSQIKPINLIGARVKAKRRIEDSPLHDTPAVNRGTEGRVEDYDHSANLFYVDFGNGAIACVANDIC